MKTVHPATSPPYVLGGCGFTQTGRELMLAQQVRRGDLNKKTFKAFFVFLWLKCIFPL